MTLWRWCAGFGLLTIVLAASFALVPDIDACGPPKGAGQWVDFQNINNVDDVRALIRPDCAARFVPALKSSMWFDALVFIPVYGAFLGLAIFCNRKNRTKAALITSCVLFAGVVADQVEGLRLLGILNSLPGTDDMTQDSRNARIAKEALLILATLGVGTLLFQERGTVRVLSVCVIAGCVLGFLGLMLQTALGEMGLLVAWLALFGAAVVKSFPSREPPLI